MSKQIKEKAEGVASGSTFLEISGKLLGKLEIMVPNKREQDEIAKLFENIDNLITLHQRKLELLTQLKKAYLQKLFPRTGQKLPEIRFANFQEDWQLCKLHDLLIKNKSRNINNSLSYVESISNQKGFIKQMDLFNNYAIASSNLSNYFVISEKQFAYNPSRINVGSIAYKEAGQEKSLISPLYVSFSTEDSVNDLYLLYWFYTKLFESQRVSLSEGGVRSSLSFDQLGKMSLIKPGISEQSSIASLIQNSITISHFQGIALKQLQILKKSFLKRLFL